MTDEERTAFRHDRRCTTINGLHVESWTMRADSCRMAVERVLPDTTIDLYFNFGNEGRHVYSGAPKERLSYRRAWVVGPHERSLLIEKEVVNCDVVGVRLPAHACRRLLNTAAREMRGEVVDLECFWAKEAHDIHDMLANEPESDRLALIEAVIARKMRAGVVDDTMTPVVIDQLSGYPERTVADCAALTGMSHRQFIDFTQAATGLTPKTLQRVLRLRRVLAHIHSRKRLPWSQIATSCGYFDQAHLINDFRQMSGMTPTEYESTRSSVGMGVAPHLLASDRARFMESFSNTVR